MKLFKKYKDKNPLLKKPPFKPVIVEGKENRLVLLDPTIDISNLPEIIQLINFVCGLGLQQLPLDLREFAQQHGAVAVAHTLNLSYENTGYEEVLRELLPSDVVVPVGFATIGHIAHFTLNPPQLPYKHLIGNVFLDKHSGQLQYHAELISIVIQCDNFRHPHCGEQDWLHRERVPRLPHGSPCRRARLHRHTERYAEKVAPQR
jgi:hypothetical protein